MPGVRLPAFLASHHRLFRHGDDSGASLRTHPTLRPRLLLDQRPAANPRGRPVRLARERRSVAIRVTESEREQLAGESSNVGMLLTQYIRKRCDLQVRTTSLPGTDERENEADDAWERLQRLELKPRDYFPADE